MSTATSIAYCGCEAPVMDIDHDAGCRRCGLPVDFSPPEPASPPKTLRSSGKHDPAARRRAQRRGRERGCWVYIPADGLARAGFAPDEPPPWYRVWAGERARYIVTLYREP